MALAVILPELFAKTDALIDNAGQRKLLTEIELPLAGVLARMECAGFDVDKAGIEAFSKKLSTRISTLTDEIFEAVGHEFNINSPKQLGVALFEDLGLPCKKKTKAVIPPMPRCWRVCALPTRWWKRSWNIAH